MAPDEVRRASSRDHDGPETSDARQRRDENDTNTDKDRDNDRDDEREDRPKDKKPSLFRNRFVQIGLGIVVIAVIAGAVLWWLHERHFEDTDDAFIDAHIVHLSPQIAGRVTAIHVQDNQLVHRGDALVDIDAADAEAKVAQVAAQKAQAEKQRDQAVATEQGAAAQAENAERDLVRYRQLQQASPLAVAQQQIDQAVAAERNATAQRDAAQAQIASAEAQIKVFNAQIATAELNLGYTHIVSPVDGHIAQRSAAVGNYVTPGQELMAIVPTELWVTANFKETQLAHMRVGQKVAIEVDACPGKTLHGHVDSLQRGAGQAFGILPPENATGNYVKVVQRVPVKILIDDPPADCPMGPGMSVEPTVTVR